MTTHTSVLYNVVVFIIILFLYMGNFMYQLEQDVTKGYLILIECLNLFVGLIFAVLLTFIATSPNLTFVDAIILLICLFIETFYFCSKLLKTNKPSLGIIFSTVTYVFLLLAFCSGLLTLHPFSFLVSIITITIIIVIFSHYLLRITNYNFIVSIILYCIVTLYYSILLIRVPTNTSSNYHLFQSYYYCYNLPDLQTKLGIIPLLSRCIQFVICRIADVLLLGQFITSVKKQNSDITTKIK